MRVQVFDSINEVDAAEWNRIVGRNRLICRHEYLRAIEASRINDCRFFYPVVYSGDEIVAHTCLYYISTKLDAFAQGIWQQMSGLIRKCWPGFLMLHSIECGTPVALGHTFSFAEGVVAEDIVLMLVDEIEKKAKSIGVGIILLRDFDHRSREDFSCIQQKGYHVLYNLPCAEFPVRWSSFEAYQQELRSHYRYKMHRHEKTFLQGRGRMVVLRDFASEADVLAALWKNVYEHAHEYRREILLADFFENMDRLLADRSSVIMAYIEDRPAGFSLMLHDDDVLTQLFCGLDYSYNEKYEIYFNMLYRVVRMGIEMNCRMIDYGITTLIPKMDIGAQVVPLQMYMKDLNPVGNLIVPRLFRAMTPSKLPPQRHVFKQ